MMPKSRASDHIYDQEPIDGLAQKKFFFAVKFEVSSKLYKLKANAPLHPPSLVSRFTVRKKKSQPEIKSLVRLIVLEAPTSCLFNFYIIIMAFNHDFRQDSYSSRFVNKSSRVEMKFSLTILHQHKVSADCTSFHKKNHVYRICGSFCVICSGPAA